MKHCNQMLLAAIAGISLTAGAFAQSSGGSSGSSGSGSGSASGGVGSQNQAGGSSSSVGGLSSSGVGSSTPADADRATAGSASSSDTASGSMTSTQDRTMQRGAMGGAADAQLSAQMDKLTSQPDKAADGLFVLDNAKGNLFEVEFARLAQTKSQDDKIKQLAQMIEKDHTAANDQLKTIAQKMGLELPTSLPSDKQKMLQVLGSLSPQDFDTCYLLDNKMAHAKDITSFADHQKSVKDEDLRKYISAVLPKLQQHGQHVQQLATEKGFPAPMGGGQAMGSINGGTDRSLTHTGDASNGDASSSSGTSSGSTGSGTGVTAGSNGATGNPTAPANNQNPSNR